MRHLRCTAFAGTERIAAGELQHVALKARQRIDAGTGAAIRIFDDRDGRLIELDWRGSVADLLRRLGEPPYAAASAGLGPGAAATRRTGPGRPRLGVVAREVTLLPRHWQWLNAQPGGASVALRRLVEAARADAGPEDRVRQSQQAAYRFMAEMAAEAPGFEDAARALFAGDAARFEEHTARWPDDVREHAGLLAQAALRA
jgi:hypothetical protein